MPKNKTNLKKSQKKKKEAYYVIHVTVRNKEKILGDGTLGATPNIECQFQSGKNDTRLLASNRDALHLITLHTQASLLTPRRCLCLTRSSSGRREASLVCIHCR